MNATSEAYLKSTPRSNRIGAAVHEDAAGLPPAFWLDYGDSDPTPFASVHPTTDTNVFSDSGADCGTCYPQVECASSSPRFAAGFAFTFLKSQFGDNIAFTDTTSDGASFEDIQPQQFRYGLETSPRVWLELLEPSGLGAQVRYWQFDHDANSLVGTPAPNGFGRLAAPVFDNIDISTTVPGQTMSAASGLELHALDLEGTKLVAFGPWGLAASAGIRYGAFKQNYVNQLRDVNGELLAQINSSRNYDGVGPTFAIEARRWLVDGFSVFSSARGALLFGSRRSALSVGEDLDLLTPFFTTQTNSRYDTVPVAELQLGLDWHQDLGPTLAFFCQVAMEAQWWQDIGSASTEDGSVGLFGFNTAFGFTW